MASSSLFRESSHRRVSVGVPGLPLFDGETQRLQERVAALTKSLDTEREARTVAEARLMALQQRQDRLVAIGRSTAEFAHQVRSPLTSALLYAGQLEQAGKSAASRTRIAGKILSGLHEMRRMADDMLGFAAGVNCRREAVNVTELLTQVRDSLNDQLSPNTVVNVSVTDPDLTLCINRDSVKGALANLVCNADQASDDGSNILLHGHRFGEAIHLCVTDDGPGIPDDIQSRVFEPFFTTARGGTGLGLAVVRAVAAAHKGKVDFHTTELGTSFSLQLPAAESKEPA